MCKKRKKCYNARFTEFFLCITGKYLQLNAEERRISENNMGKTAFIYSLHYKT
jgi:hypothetical protein